MSDSVLSEQEIEAMREGGKIWIEIRKKLQEEIKPGVTGKYLNDKAYEFFLEHDVKPVFNEFEDFPGYICVSVNDCIIHGVGDDIPLKSGDKITLDVGFRHKGICIDSAFTRIVDPETNPEYQSFISKCEKAFWIAARKVKEIVESGQVLYNGDIASAIEGYIKELKANWKKMSLIDGYVGHTIGKNVHQKPHIFNKGLPPRTGDIVRPNTVICIEPMILNQGHGLIRRKPINTFNIYSKESDVYTCHVEHMVLIKTDGIEVLTATEEEKLQFNL